MLRESVLKTISSKSMMKQFFENFNQNKINFYSFDLLLYITLYIFIITLIFLHLTLLYFHYIYKMSHKYIYNYACIL